MVNHSRRAMALRYRAAGSSTGSSLGPTLIARVLQVHPLNPQPRLISQAAGAIRSGQVIAYPTDSSYALGCRIGDKGAMERIKRLRHLDRHHNFTLVCRDLSEIATYAKVDNAGYRILRSGTPGPFTFILRATHEVPRRLQNPRRKTIGIRVPEGRIVRALLEELGEPVMSTTLLLPDEDLPLSEAEEILDRVGHELDLIVDGGACSRTATTILDLTEEIPRVVRAGRGDVSAVLGGQPAVVS